jgi:uroporphyrinogen decarboxylase
MNALENFRLLADGQSPAWIPFTLDVGALPGLSGPVQRKFEEVTGSADAAGYFETDVRRASVTACFGGRDPASLHRQLPAGTTFDEWGIGHWAGGLEATLDRMYAPLADATRTAQVEALPEPLLTVADCAAAVERYHAAGYPVLGYAGSIYEWSWWLRGMQRFMLDLAEQQAMAEAVIDKVRRHTTRLAVTSARLGIDVLCFYDDAGTQRGMQISPQHWRRFVKPAWRQVLAAAREAAPGVKLFLHSCGRIDAILPDLVELGFDLLHPVQPECMDFESVYRQWGRKIIPCATISSQRILPFGTPDEVRAEVRRLARVAADRRTMILPSNVIQPETPWENVLALADECRRLTVGSIRCGDPAR